MTAPIAPSRRSIPIGRLGAPPRAGGALEANATIVGRADLTPTVATFAIRPDAGVPPFLAGQYFSVGLPVDGRLLQRPYSAASTQAADAIDLVIRLVRGGELTPQLWRLGPGDRVRVGPPKGLFHLVSADPRPHLLLATGTGIGPLIAMTAELSARPVPPRTVVVHGVADAGELAMRERLERAASRHRWLDYVPTISRPLDPVNSRWTGLVGRVDAALPVVLDRTRIQPAEAVALVCGNPIAIATICDALVGLGMPRAAMVSEAYWPEGLSHPNVG